MLSRCSLFRAPLRREKLTNLAAARLSLSPAYLSATGEHGVATTSRKLRRLVWPLIKGNGELTALFGNRFVVERDESFDGHGFSEFEKGGDTNIF